MAKAAPKIVLNSAQDIPFDKLVLSQKNVRKIKRGVSIADLAEDVAVRGLLQSLNVRPIIGDDGEPTDMFEVPAGGRRYGALELLVKSRRLRKDAPVPCVVKTPTTDGTSAEDDSLAENLHRLDLDPLDEYRGMRILEDQGLGVETIAARFKVTPAVVRQRLKLAAVSPRLHEVYEHDGMTLDQLMAFSVADDHERQEQVWAFLDQSYNKSPSYIRQKLTENTVRAADPRVLFVGLDAYVAAGGGVMRDLFEPDGGGWLTDPVLLDRLVGEKLQAERERVAAEGWKWVVASVTLPYDVTRDLREIAREEIPLSTEEAAQLATLQAEADDIEEEWAERPDIPDEVIARMDALDAQIAALNARPFRFAEADMARAGAFVAMARDGSLVVDRGYVRPEDEPAPEPDSADETDAGERESVDGAGLSPDSIAPRPAGDTAEDDGDDEGVKPLPDKLVAELTAFRTVALQDAVAQTPAIAFVAVLHAFALRTFFQVSSESCVEVSLNRVGFAYEPPALRDTPAAKAIAERHAQWKARLPKSDKDLWEALLALDADDQANLFAHCAALAVNAQFEAAPKYDNGRISAHTIQRRLEHSHVLARATGLDLVEAGWKPTYDNYFGRLTKPRILADVADAKGARFAEMIDHLKKADMAREAERLLEDVDWLPDPLRTPDLDGASEATVGDAGTLPAFLDDDGEDVPDAGVDEPIEPAAIAAE